MLQQCGYETLVLNSADGLKFSHCANTKETGSKK